MSTTILTPYGLGLVKASLKSNRLSESLVTRSYRKCLIAEKFVLLGSDSTEFRKFILDNLPLENMATTTLFEESSLSVVVSVLH